MADCSRPSYALTVTLFAPEVESLPRLAWLAEIGALSAIDGVDVQVVGGPDTRKNDVAAGLRRRADVMIWSGHGEPGGLALGRATVVRPQWLATQVRCGIPRLLVVAACGSLARDEHMRSLAAEVAKAGINVVGFPLEADDMAAATYNIELIRALRAGASVGTATDVALESIADEFAKTAKGVFLMPGLTNGYRDIVVRLEAVECGQRSLLERMDLVLDALGGQRPVSGVR